MRRAWFHRFMGLLWLALCSTVVLPWAHGLTHLSGHAPATASTSLSALLTSAASSDDAAVASAITAQPAETDTGHTADACLVCAHLAGQLSSHGSSADRAVASAYQPPAPREVPRTRPADPAWLTPASRAPPSLTA